MSTNERAYYKLDVDVKLRALNPPIYLPLKKHRLWSEIEQHFYAGKSVDECVEHIKKLIRGE